MVFNHPGGQQTLLIPSSYEKKSVGEPPQLFDAWFQKKWRHHWIENWEEFKSEFIQERWSQNSSHGFVDVVCELMTPVQLEKGGVSYRQVNFRRRFWDITGAPSPLSFSVYSGFEIPQKIQEMKDTQDNEKELRFWNNLGCMIYALANEPQRKDLPIERTDEDDYDDTNIRDMLENGRVRNIYDGMNNRRSDFEQYLNYVWHNQGGRFS